MTLTTRDFLKLSGGAAFAGAAETSWAAKAAPYTGPKVRLAAIGTGGQANALLRPDWSAEAMAAYGAAL